MLPWKRRCYFGAWYRWKFCARAANCKQWMWLQPQGLISDLFFFLLILFLLPPQSVRLQDRSWNVAKGRDADWKSILFPAKLAHLAFSDVPQCMDFGGWKSLNCLSLGLQGVELQTGDSGNCAAQTNVQTGMLLKRLLAWETSLALSCLLVPKSGWNKVGKYVEE